MKEMLQKLSTSNILDLIVAAILIVFIVRGHFKGLIMMLSGAAALIAGVFGGSYAAGVLSKPVANAIFLPFVSKALAKSAEGVQLPQSAAVAQNGQLAEGAKSSIAGVIEHTKLPGFSISGVVDNLAQRVKETGAEILNATAQLISERIAYILLFIVAFVLIQILVVLLFRALNLVSKAPVLNTFNKWGGAAVGLLTGALLVLVGMWLALTFIQPATKPGALLSAEVIEQSFVAKYFDRVIKTFMP